MRRLTALAQDALRKQLSGYKMVLFVPALPKPPLQAPNLTDSRRVRRAAVPEPRAVRDTRILDRLDPRLLEFIKEHPALDRIFTHEMIRDIDKKILSVGTLLEKSSLKVRFEVDEGGRIVNRKMEESSKVPSIDHLALETISLLEKFQFLAPMKGLKTVTATIEIDTEIEIRFEGEAADEIAAEAIRKQLQNMLTLMRFALGKDEAAFVLDDVSLLVREKRVEVSKVFEKQPLVDFLMQYYSPRPRPEQRPIPPPHLGETDGVRRFPAPETDRRERE